MNSKLSLCLGAVMVITAIASKSYGWGDYPHARMSLSGVHTVDNDAWYVSAGNSLHMDASSWDDPQNPDYSYDSDSSEVHRLPDWTHGIKRWQWDWHFDGFDTWDYTEDFFSPPAGDDGWVINGATSHTYPNPGQYNLRLKVTDDDAYEGLGDDKPAQKMYKVNVVSVGLVAERGYVGVNDDDDDENGIMDKYDGGTQPAENDLVKILLSVDTPESTDKVKLSVSPSEDYGRIKIWSDADKQSLVIPDNGNYYKMWSAGAGTGGLPTELWVEAISASRVNGPPDGPSLTLTYIAMDGQQEKPVPRDPAATITFTFLEVDMDMDGVQDESQFTHEITPGGFIPLHDVVKITLHEPQPTLQRLLPIDAGHPVTLRAVSGGSKIRIWENESKTGDPVSLPATYTSRSEFPDYLWVEGITVSSYPRDITLAMEYTIAGKTFDDRINITVLEVDLDMTGVADAVEESPGGFLALNDDDNNWNGTTDKDDAPPVANEDDLVKLEFRLLPESLPVDAGHPVTLEAVAGEGKIKIYHNSDKSGTSIGLPFAFISRQAMSEGIWVEGFASSSSLGDVELKMTYEYDGQDVGHDTVRLTVIDVDITEPDGSLDAGRNPSSSWESSPCYHFDFQGITSGEPGSYALTISGAISPSLFTYQWSLPSSCGTLSSTTVPSPTHTEPTSPGEGILDLEAVYSGTPTGIVEKRKVKIYQDHLARDYANFGTGTYHYATWEVTTFNVDPYPTMGQWNCHGSTWHHWNGSGGGSQSGLPPVGTPKKVVTVTHQSGGGGSHPPLGTLNRGDIVVYYQANGPPMHSQTCTGNGTESYGANNEPLTYPGMPGPPPGGNESWKWATSTAGDWANDLWLPGTGIMPVVIKVYDKP